MLMRHFVLHCKSQFPSTANITVAIATAFFFFSAETEIRIW